MASAGDRDGSAVVEGRLLLPFEGDATDLATSDGLPARSTLAWKHTRGPCGVAMVAWCLRAIAVTVARCLPASVLSMEVNMTHCRRLSLHTSCASR